MIIFPNVSENESHDPTAAKWGSLRLVDIYVPSLNITHAHKVIGRGGIILWYILQKWHHLGSAQLNCMGRQFKLAGQGTQPTCCAERSLHMHWSQPPISALGGASTKGELQFVTWKTATHLVLQQDHHPLLHIAPPNMCKLMEEHLEGVSNQLSQRKTSDLLVQKVWGNRVVMDNNEVKWGVRRLVFCAGTSLVVCLATSSSPTTMPMVLLHTLRWPTQQTSQCHNHSATTRPACEVQHVQDTPASEWRITVMALLMPCTPCRLNGAKCQQQGWCVYNNLAAVTGSWQQQGQYISTCYSRLYCTYEVLNWQ